MNIIENLDSRHLLKTLVLLLVTTILLIACSSGLANTTLPPPPKIGSQAFDANDPIGYLISTIRYVIFLGLTIVVVFALIGFSSGLISEVNEARRKGEWGRFSIYFGAGLLVILVVIFGAWWGSERLSSLLTL